MELKFVSILKSFFPVGKIWEFQTNFNYLIDGISVEFGRMYKKATDFYNNFNIINSEELAQEHGQDYLIDISLYTKLELQRIIVEYINKDLPFKEIIEDFATFIGYPIQWRVYGRHTQFGEFEFAQEFGDENDPAYEIMTLVIILDEDIDCPNFRKIRFLVDYLKPPYLNVDYVNKPNYNNNYIELGNKEFAMEFGEITEC